MKTNNISDNFQSNPFKLFTTNILCNKIYYELFKKHCMSQLEIRKKNKPEHNYFEIDYFMNLINNTTSKVQTYHDTNELLFVNMEHKNIFNETYNKTSLCYNALNRFSILCKIKYTKKYECNTDLCMNDLSDYKPCQIIKLVEDGRVYAFWGKDLYNLIKKKLTNNYHLHPEPLSLKNPYTNKEISIANLYNIYFRLKDMVWGVPYLYECYMKTNFNISYFLEFYCAEIREEVINELIRFMSDDDIYKNTNKMLKLNKSVVGDRSIDKKFPREILRKYMLGYVKLFLLSLYSVCFSKKFYYTRILRTKLKIFFKDNIHFGREITKREPIYEDGSKFIKTGKYKMVKYFNTDIIYNTFYHKKNFNGNRNIEKLVHSKTNLKKNYIKNNQMKRVISTINDDPIQGYTVEDDWGPIESDDCISSSDSEGDGESEINFVISRDPDTSLLTSIVQEEREFMNG